MKENLKLTTNAVQFQKLLTEEYTKLFVNDIIYEYVAGCRTPQDLAKNMVYEILNGNAFVGGQGVQSVCKQLGIKGNKKHIVNYLLSGE